MARRSGEGSGPDPRLHRVLGLRGPQARREARVRGAHERDASGRRRRRRAASHEERRGGARSDLLALLALATARGLALEKLANKRAVPDKAVGELLAALLG